MGAIHAKTLVSSLAFLSSLSLTGAAVSKRALTVPATLPGAWKYQGCYTDVGRTINDAAYTDGANMTDINCINFCTSKGFQYAGTEYSSECYCGSALAPAAAKANEADCSTACSGDQTSACGGGNRLSLFYSSQPVGPQPNPGVNGWSYIGCYSEGTTGRTLGYGVGTIPNAQMTVAKCTAACKAANYILAGVEYGGECYCGNTIDNGGAPASSGCNMLCNGNQTEFCGGGSRLNVYDYMMKFPVSSSTSKTSTTTAATSTSTSTKKTTTTTTSKTTSTTSKSSTTSKTSTSTKPTTSTSTKPTTTTTPISSKATTSTTSTSTKTSTSSSSTSTVQPTGPVQPAAVGGYSWYGCQTEATGARALSGATFAADTMTLESCQTFCANFNFFGVEYARECYCGNTFNAGSVFAPATDCSMTCSGNALEYCGAGNRLSVYSKTGGTNSASSSSTTTTKPTGTATVSTSTTSAPPAGTGYPTGWSDQGCWIDGANGRILSYQAPDSQTLTRQSCAQTCFAAGYTISGTEWSQQCFCGNSIINGGKQTADADCNSPCSGNNQQTCGAGGRMNIVSKGKPTVVLPPAVQTGGLGDWTYQGCVEDNVNQKRTFQWQLFFPNTMTASQCLNQCGAYGYMAAGLEYGEECYCGDPANVKTSGATYRPETECNVVCAGNSSAYCGGGGRLSTYFWTGKPFYSWTFPQDYRAGKYDLLANGVTIPLMTMQSITGKVTFMSKYGTGKANETGAYELDLTQIGTAKAWRPLHVKTDIFCAAGLVLPDKGGRQLTIGGWAGDSTFGVRLYWPDGSAGVFGTHDWQENVNELTLQAGRWYPSAMVMSNGSIMVIGGEVGSNGAAVPSIEVLPATGGKPVYMDWLDRTNPNNLYPFVAVMPKSGNIFVAYWNEARLLNPANFATVKQLPNAPGAVNDDTSGRTYPLEGTAVLLPQKAPYTDDITVLICGGSNNGPGNALDNCVSTQPEAANPKWVIERMPSTRVMPCMAPLPDGTYLIANGAFHGVAGFGLAVGPNLNALLYDPSKEAGSRITVMANTTIARLYHSEAITLLDGRVLISGSNPEDDVNPEEYRVEVFSPPYLLGGKPRPSFTVANKDWTYGQAITVNVGAVGNGAITASLLGAVSSTHGNSLGARTLIPAISCNGGTCTVTAPPNSFVCPPGWYQFFILDGGIPAVGVYVRIGGDPAQLGNWPNFPDFTKPGV